MLSCISPQSGLTTVHLKACCAAGGKVRDGDSLGSFAPPTANGGVPSLEYVAYRKYNPDVWKQAAFFVSSQVAYFKLHSPGNPAVDGVTNSNDLQSALAAHLAPQSWGLFTFPAEVLVAKAAQPWIATPSTFLSWQLPAFLALTYPRTLSPTALSSPLVPTATKASSTGPVDASKASSKAKVADGDCSFTSTPPALITASLLSEQALSSGAVPFCPLWRKDFLLQAVSLTTRLAASRSSLINLSWDWRFPTVRAHIFW
mmetsp:Transcript_25638/g.56473  ORF Transcript_25638/g.56473 Transcript_25638/m.56473 type:complete len:258 (+) Transcript_25638:191-964(+)